MARLLTHLFSRNNTLTFKMPVSCTLSVGNLINLSAFKMAKSAALSVRNDRTVIVFLPGMNRLKRLLNALGIGRKNSSGQLLKYVLLNTAIELFSYEDQSFFSTEFYYCKYEPNHWLSFCKESNENEWLSSASPNTSPSCGTTLEHECFNNAIGDASVCNEILEDQSSVKRPNGQDHLGIFQECLLASSIPTHACSLPEIHSPCSVMETFSAGDCRPPTTQIQMTPNDCEHLLYTNQVDTFKIELNSELILSISSAMSSWLSVSLVDLVIPGEKSDKDPEVGMLSKEKDDFVKYAICHNDPILSSSSIGSPSFRDGVKDSVTNHECGVQTDTLSYKMFELASGDLEREASLYGTFHKQDDEDLKQSISWDSYDLHLSRSLRNSHPSQLYDWVLMEQDELCGIEKLLSKAEAVLQEEELVLRGEEDLENLLHHIGPYHTYSVSENICEKQILSIQELPMDLLDNVIEEKHFSSTPNKSRRNPRRNWDLPKSIDGQICFAHSVMTDDRHFLHERIDLQTSYDST